MSKYNNKPLKYDDYIKAVHELLKRRVNSSRDNFYHFVFLFLQRLHGFDSGMFTQNTRLVDKNGKRVLEPNYHYLFKRELQFTKDYWKVSCEDRDGAIDFVLLVKEGTFIDSLNPLIDYYFFKGRVFDCCIDHDIAGEMLYTFKCYGENNYTTIAMYRAIPRKFFTEKELNHQRKLHSFILALCEKDLNESFAIYNQKDNKLYADELFPEQAKKEIYEHIAQSKPLTQSRYILNVFYINIQGMMPFTIFISRILHSDHTNTPLLAIDRNGDISYQQAKIVQRIFNSPEQLTIKILKTQKALEDLKKELDTTLDPGKFPSVNDFHYHRRCLRIRLQVLSFELGKLLTLQSNLVC